MYTVHQAKSQLSKLLKEVEEGKEVIIARGDRPVARLVPVRQPKRRGPGSMKGQIHISPGFYEPMTEEELKDWGIS
jgi:prevent-host-death family protein